MKSWWSWRTSLVNKLDEEDEREREILKRKYLKQSLDSQTNQIMINKRQQFVLNEKEASINKPIIDQMNKSQFRSLDDVQGSKF